MRYRDLVDSPAQTLDEICLFLGVRPGLITHVPRENVTAHPRRTSQHAVISRLARTSAAAGRLLPGAAAAGMTRSLERFLQRSAGSREPLTWQQRQQCCPIWLTTYRG